MKFGIAVIIYNPDESVLKRLDCYKKVSDNILIIDNSEKKNANSDKIANDKKLRYYWMKKNIGLAKALNVIFEIAFKERFDYILTMDQDSDFNPENINLMLNYIEENDNGIIAIFCPNYCKLYWNEKKRKNVKGKLLIRKDRTEERIFSMTSGSFVNVRLVQDVLPLEDYFIGYVDNLLCYSLVEKNYKIKMIGNVVFEQQVGEKVKSNFYNRFFHVIHHKNERYYYMVRNNLFLQKQFFENKIILNNLKKNLIRIIINIVIGEKGKKAKIEACRKGYKDFKEGVLGKKS